MGPFLWHTEVNLEEATDTYKTQYVNFVGLLICC